MGSEGHTTSLGLRSGAIGIRRSVLDDIAPSVGFGEAICTMREFTAVVNRPQNIEDEETPSFFGGSGTTPPSQCKVRYFTR